MKKGIFLFFMVAAAITVKAQGIERLTFATALGTGVCINTPVSTPFQWQVFGLYNFNKRLSAGTGTGLLFYEKMLIPLFAHIRYHLTRPHKFIPFVGCTAGYSFAPSRKANGGGYLSPSLGIQYVLSGHLRISLSAGYERQNLERLKSYEDSYFKAEFEEQLTHHVISFKVGFVF